MCSNAWDAVTDEPLGGCEEYVILDDTEKEGGAKLLVVGLVEEAWLVRLVNRFALYIFLNDVVW